MAPIDERAEPFPRAVKRDIECWHPNVLERISLPVGDSAVPCRFLEVLDERRSIRQIKEASQERIASLLWHAVRTRETGIRSDGLLWQRRASPSAGGLHPIDLLLLPPSLARVERYNPVLHAIEILGDVDASAIERGRDRLRSLIPEAAGTCIVVVADLARTEAVYESAISLAWRDAGALLATLQLTATALSLGFCCLGLLGHEVVASLGGPSTLFAVGAAVVGER